MQRQSLEVQTLYAELLEQLNAFEAHRSIGHAPGTFVTKTVKGDTYYYFQYLEPGGRKRQVYLGPKSEHLDRLAQTYLQSRSDIARDRESIVRLGALLRVGGALVTDAPSARVVRALADAGVFHLGGVLVGTHAYLTLGNVLGVRWDGAGLRTQDLDVAASRTLEIGLADTPLADVPSALASLEMGFLPVPGLDPRTPSTSFKVRGQGLRVDLLTPQPARRGTRGPDTGAILIPRLHAAAQPLKYLDYLLENPVKGAVVNGEPVLVSVPAPARFALHKLIVAMERPAAFAAKREKDLRQAAEVLGVLATDRPGDTELAWEALSARGKGWVTRARQGFAALRAVAPEVAEGIESVIGAR